ncbi:UvrD-helicase domain-containing protein [Variovorax sp. KBS0712]|uniref:UvrD-helicase domain-containing protein n=1 Tax=Variovorax sp. KBS0712 TaxID=2578111 RepID=UPI00163D4DD5|nr:ATP-dependent helicase [Variovorax sp. KBS0712]
MELNPQAKAIVQADARYVEVMACAGSGKTTVLVHRLAHLMVTRQVPASAILVLSFSNATVSEVRLRLARFESEEAHANAPAVNGIDSVHLQSVTVKTAHAFARQVTRSISGSRNLPSLMKPAEIIEFMARAATTARKSLGKDRTIAAERRLQLQAWLKALSASDLKAAHALIDFGTATDQSIKQLVKLERFAAQFGPYRLALQLLRLAYQAIKLEHRKIDYTDMLIDARTALGARAGTTALHNIKYIVVDEYQDSSLAQLQFIAELARRPGVELTVLGDQQQSIFRYAGAAAAGHALSELLPGVVSMPLSHSYRVPQTVAAATTAMLRHGDLIDVPTMTGRPGGSKPVLVHSADLARQLAAVTNDVQARLTEGVAASDIVILARVKSTLREVGAALLARGIDTDMRGTVQSTEHALQVLRLVHLVELHQAGQSLTLRALRQRLSRGLSVKASGQQWTEALQHLHRAGRGAPLEGRYIRCAAIYLRLMGGVRADADRRADVNRWAPLCRDHQTADEMRQALAKLASSPRITLSSIHKAKGGEWKHVFIVGVADGQMPNYLSRGKDALIEERSLLHVAMTRASETVRLYCAPVQHARSRQKFDRLSHFLDHPGVLRYFEVEDRR